MKINNSEKSTGGFQETKKNSEVIKDALYHELLI